MATQVTNLAPGRTLGVIVRIEDTRERGFGFIMDAENNEYFLHRTACVPNDLFDLLTERDAVSFKVSTTPKGQKAHDVRKADGAEVRQVEKMEENRGNR